MRFIFEPFNHICSPKIIHYRAINKFILIIISLTAYVSAYAAEDTFRVKSVESAFAFDNRLEFFIGPAFRFDSLNWNEAGANVNIASELKWDNLAIAQIEAGLKFNINNNWIAYATFDFGRVSSGSNQDSDYNGDNRTLEYSRSNNEAGGEVMDASIALGRAFPLLTRNGDNWLTITPQLGLAIHQQYLTMSNGFQTLPASGSFPGLNNSYNAQWRSTWMGVDTRLMINPDWYVTAKVEYHWADYTAYANWNLRTEFQHPLSFVHTAKGHGLLLSGGAIYLINTSWNLNLKISVYDWQSDAGIDQTFFSDGTVAFYKLNEVNWKSTAFSFRLSRHF